MYLVAPHVSDLDARGAGAFAGIDQAVTTIARGEMVVVVDPRALGGQENPSSLVMGAEKVTPEAVNFMASRGRGLISVALPRERLDRLEIAPMAVRPTNPRHAAFHVAVDHRTSTTTGISAADRAATIAALADPDSLPGDFARPGHVLPLACEEGGVAVRSAVPEAAVNLGRMAGLVRAAVVCEILADDGDPARLPALLEFGARHGIPVVAVGDLVNGESRADR